ncbi:MAG: potassium channel family protein [Planctomycetota bacterium]|jgi:Trk K+ transport system NAD-binding subunit
MKYVAAQLMQVLRQRRAKRNIRLLLRFFLVLIALVTVYSTLFHYIMMWEGREHSWLTGFYWTLTVMSTLGFGDITFESDLGRFFSMVVLVSGIIFLLILLPFTIIQFFYAPWVEAQAAARAPRELPADTRGHVILTHHDPVTAALIRKLEQFGYEYVLVVPELDEAMRHHDLGLRVAVGQLDNPETYRRVRAEQAVLVATTQSDIVNTNVAFAVRQAAPDVPVLATATTTTSPDILARAGATRVLRIGEMVGKALARCTIGGDAVTHLVGRVDELVIAEANAHRTPLVGKTLRENRLSDLGVSVIGIWDRGNFQPASPDSVIGPNTILLLAGSSKQFEAYDEEFVIYNVSVKPVAILGGGRVGGAAARALTTRGVDWRIVDRVPGCMPDGDRVIVGDAGDPKVLKKAGLLEAPAVLITTHDDNLNIYLTIYCRSVRPDIEIISRCTLERNVDMLHRAGADFVLSFASMGATSIFNQIKTKRSRILTIAEGLDVFRVQVPQSLLDKTIAESGVREQTGCTIVAVRHDGGLQINPRPETRLSAGREMILVGSGESESRFLDRFVEG